MKNNYNDNKEMIIKHSMPILGSRANKKIEKRTKAKENEVISKKK